MAEEKATVFYYYERKTFQNNEKQDVLTKFSFNDFPQHL